MSIMSDIYVRTRRDATDKRLRILHSGATIYLLIFYGLASSHGGMKRVSKTNIIKTYVNPTRSVYRTFRLKRI